MTATEKSEIEIILATPGSFTVAGIPAAVHRLKSRELLSLLGIITTGLGPGVANIRFTGDAEEAKSQFVALVMLAIPNALDDMTTFLRSVVTAKNPDDQAKLWAEMENPDPEDLIDLIQVIAEQEKDDLGSLVGKAQAALTKIQGLYQKPKKK